MNDEYKAYKAKITYLRGNEVIELRGTTLVPNLSFFRDYVVMLKGNGKKQICINTKYIISMEMELDSLFYTKWDDVVEV